MNISGNIIIKDVLLNEKDLKDNTYQFISFNNFRFFLSSYNAIKQKKITYKCINKRKLKNKPKNDLYFCDATIVAIRENNNNFEFYFKKNHSDICAKEHVELYDRINDIKFEQLKNNNNNPLKDSLNSIIKIETKFNLKNDLNIGNESKRNKKTSFNEDMNEGDTNDKIKPYYDKMPLKTFLSGYLY